MKKLLLILPIILIGCTFPEITGNICVVKCVRKDPCFCDKKYSYDVYGNVGIFELHTDSVYQMGDTLVISPLKRPVKTADTIRNVINQSGSINTNAQIGNNNVIE